MTVCKTRTWYGRGVCKSDISNNVGTVKLFLTTLSPSAPQSGLVRSLWPFASMTTAGS
jgi:hypothetical protein